MIQLRPFDEMAALSVFQRLDPMDHIEAELVRGHEATGAQLWADWRAAQAWRVLSYLVLTDPARGSTPFAVFGISHTGQSGVAQAALLARNHDLFKRPLVQLARMIAAGLPAKCTEMGVHRIEARCWADHPTAASLLRAIGFQHEADMRGFGRDGTATYRQFAWTSPAIERI